MGRSSPTVGIAAVERVFQRQHWRYELRNGRIVTRFEGVSMLLGVESSGSAVVIIAPLYVAGAAHRRASQAHEHEVDTFLSAVNSDLTMGAYIRDVDAGDIYYMLGVQVRNGQVDDQELAEAIAYTVAVVKSLGPTVTALVEGQATLNDALEALRRALANARRRQTA